MQKKYENLEEFNKDFYKSNKNIKVFGNAGLIKLNDMVQAKFILTNSNISGRLDVIDLQIIHKTNGILDTQRFKFNDYFSKEDRIDNRLSDYSTTFHVWDEYSSWYICTPSEQAIKNFIKKLIEYTKFYR